MQFEKEVGIFIHFPLINFVYIHWFFVLFLCPPVFESVCNAVLFIGLSLVLPNSKAQYTFLVVCVYICYHISTYLRLWFHNYMSSVTPI
jgi:hypothetical protein